MTKTVRQKVGEMNNPSAYIKTARETLETKKARDKFVEENKHLALQFPIKGLETKIPPVQIGETAIYGAGSYQGKSLFLKHWMFEMQKKVDVENRRAVIAYVSHEDTAEMTAAQQLKKYGGNETKYEDDLFLYIGRSFGMKAEEIAEMHMTNIVQLLEYARKEKFAEEMPFAMIGYDFIQKTPPDPFRKNVVSDQQRRLQVADDMLRLTNAAVQMPCPIVCAAQTGLKSLNTPYSKEMPIPGDGDFEESKEIYQYADHAYTGWLPRQDYPVGSLVESGNWSFTVKEDLYFIRVLKARYCDPVEWKGIGKVYPVFIKPDGSFEYDVEYHKSIYKKKQ